MGTMAPSMGVEPGAGVDAVLVDRSAVWVDLEVEMAARCVSEVAYLADLLARGHGVAGVYVDPTHVCVPGGKPAAAGAHLNEPPSGPRLVGANKDCAGGGREHGGPAGHGEVGAGMAVRPVATGTTPVSLVHVAATRRKRESDGPRRCPW